jgi:DNA-binding protein YbaB
VNDELLQRLDNLRGEAERLSAQLAWVADTTQTGHDRSGSVSLSLNGDCAITGFKLNPAWRQHLAPDALGSAIVEAYASAAKAVMEAFARRANHLVEGGEIPDLDTPPTLVSQLPPPSPDETAAFARQLYNVLNEADERMPELRDHVKSQVGRQSRVASPTGMVHLAISNGVLAHIDINERWLRETTDGGIQIELDGVLRSAFRGVSQQATQAAGAIPPIRDVLAAAGTPAELLRLLGLTS